MTADLPVEAMAQVVGWHFGSLHPYENMIALGLAFGPFVVLAIVIVLRRRDEGDDDGDGERAER